MKAIILVGGEGTRLRPLTLHTPKPLLPIANIPFLVRQLNWLKSHGVTEVVLSLGYLPDAFEKYFASNPIEGIKLSYVVEDQPLGTAGAIKFAAQDVGDDFIVCNGDVLTDMDLSALVDFHRSNGSMATISLTYVEDPSAFGVVPTHDDGRVIAFVEKPPRESAPSHWINAGTYILKKEFLDLIPEDIQVSVERETFPKLLADGEMYAVESQSYWLDIGTPEKYIQAHNDCLLSVFENDFASVGEIIPNLYGPSDVVVGSNVKVLSPSIVGSGVVIGDNVVLSCATIGARSVIEDDVVLENCVIHEGVRIEASSKISKSAVGEASTIGRDVALENLTWIGAHEKIEPNTQLQAQKVPSSV